jgi:hypothetical protein
MKRLAHVEAAKEEAQKYGASYKIEKLTKHICLVLSLNNKCRKVFLSLTPRDNKVCHVVREDVRKKIKEMVE